MSMFRNISITIIFALVFLLCAVPMNAANRIGGAVDTTGEINGAPYRIVIPEEWNGTLLVFGHGYRDKADHPGEVDNRNPDIAPNAALAAALIAQGYALA